MGLLLIGVAAWGKGFGLVSSIHIIGGVIAVGVFLLLIAMVGLVGAVRHHQVMLFFVSFARARRRRRKFKARRALNLDARLASTWSFFSSSSSFNLECPAPAWR